MGSLTDKKIAMIIAPKNFRDEEYFQPKVMLQAQGAEIHTIADSKEEEATGMKNGKAKIDTSLDKASAAKYDGIVFVGGLGASKYFNNKKILDLAKEAVAAGKVVGAICIAPSILANAGVLSGKKATCFPSEKGNLEKAGAQVLNKPVVTDAKIVTATGPEAAMDFGRELVKALSS